MSWWLITLLILLLIVGIGLGVWGFANVFGIYDKSHKANKLINKNSQNQAITELTTKKTFTINQIKNLPDKQLKGIYALYVGPEIDQNEFFIPILIKSSHNLYQAFDDDYEEIFIAINHHYNDIYPKIIEYLNHTNKTVDDLRWTILETIEDKNILDSRYNYWITEFKTNERGFNK